MLSWKFVSSLWLVRNARNRGAVCGAPDDHCVQFCRGLCTLVVHQAGRCYSGCASVIERGAGLGYGRAGQSRGRLDKQRSGTLDNI
jgi:hypothetical protein